MAVLILAMLFIGIAMVSSLSDYHLLVAIHKPLGILILILVAIRLVNQLFPAALAGRDAGLAAVRPQCSHWLLYVLTFALPLSGWGMLSAAAYPIMLVGSLHRRLSEGFLIAQGRHVWAR
jgi:cytochrome b561